MSIHPMEEYQAPEAGKDAKEDEEQDELEEDEEEAMRDQSPMEEAAREPSEASCEMVSEQGMMSDPGHHSDFGDATEIGKSLLSSHPSCRLLNCYEALFRLLVCVCTN